jgi:hypothetical protein
MIKWGIAVACGALLCTVLDHLHATHGVLVYPHPRVWRQAWWVPFLFGAATVVVLGAVEPVRRLLGGRRTAVPSVAELASAAIAFVAAYGFTSFGHRQPDVVWVLLTAWWVSRVLVGTPGWVIAFCLLTALGGTSFEAGWSALGFFHYLHPDLLGVPRWLPCIYLHVGLLAVPVAAQLRNS